MMVSIDRIGGTRAVVGESVLWCERRARLFWIDVRAGLLFCTDPQTGVTTSSDLGEPIGFIALTDGDALVVGLQSGLALFDPNSGHRTFLVDPEPQHPDHRPNDGAVSRDGTLIYGTLPLGDRTSPVGALYRFGAGFGNDSVIEGLHVPNGLAFSPDNTTLYFSDSWPSVRMIWQCAYDTKSGAIGQREPFFDTREVDGRPDGACVDEEGFYWMAGTGGAELVRISPEGRVDRRIKVPVERPTKPCFGGRSLDTLYFTSIGMDTPEAAPDGHMFALVPGVRGLPEPRVRGAVEDLVP